MVYVAPEDVLRAALSAAKATTARLSEDIARLQRALAEAEEELAATLRRAETAERLLAQARALAGETADGQATR